MNIISFPRSGQHLIESVMRHLCLQHNIDFTYCEYYGCCKTIPCSKGYLFSKNPDFSLDLEIKKDVKHIVLYRSDMILQLESYYRFATINKDTEYNYNNLLNFIRENTRYYNNFLEKWINNNYDNIIKIEYYDFVNNPIKYSKIIFSHFFPNCEIKEDIFNELPNINLSIHRGFKSTNLNSKIQILNKMNDDLYNRIKLDLIN